MASTYSTSLKIQLMGNGEDSGTWGTITNTNWNLMEQAVSGVDTIIMSNANYTLTNLNGVSDEARNMVIVATGTNSAIYQIIAPLVPKFYIISNQTIGGYAITVGASTGSIITIPSGITAQVYCDGVNGFYSAQTGSAGNFLVNGNLSVTGNEVEVGNLTVGGNLAVSGSTALTTATAYSPSPSDNSNNIATTAYVKTNLNGLGTMATQNANNVSISGGTINNVSGTNSGLNVGFATNSTNATNATNANYATNAGTATYGATQPVTDNSTYLATTAFVRSIIPSGIIMLWSGSSGSIPSGWYLCNGANGTPNLENQFIVGAGGSYGVGASGGSTNTTLSVANLPAHSHGVTDSGHSHPVGANNFTSAATGGGTPLFTPTLVGYYANTSTSTTGISIQNTGSGTSFSTLPPYYALCYIMKA